MKYITELSKTELISAFMNQFPTKNFSQYKLFLCASCGENSHGRFYYICDRCQRHFIEQGKLNLFSSEAQDSILPGHDGFDPNQIIGMNRRDK